MPRYDFACKFCDFKTEQFFDFHDEHKVICPNCDTDMQKVYAATPAIFQGGGWGGQ